eukprot:6499217-Karenia_brevis.AAC.1
MPRQLGKRSTAKVFRYPDRQTPLQRTLPSIDSWPEPSSSRGRARRNPSLGKDRDVIGNAHDADNEHSDGDEQDWIAWASWTFCPKCGRRRADGKLVANWKKFGARAVAIACPSGCDFHPQQLCADESNGVPCEGGEAEKAQTAGPLRAYVTPSNTRDNMLAVCQPDASMQPADAYGPNGEYKWSEMYPGPGDHPGKGDWPECILSLGAGE